MKIRRITLARIGKNETVKYAVDELYSYLKKIDNTLFVDIRFYKEYDPCIKNVIWVGESEGFSDKLLPVDDKFFDDSICIDIENNEGFITGCNPRAVLIASYRLLKEMGVAWVRASDDSEIVPHYEIDKINVKVQEKASYRHRGGKTSITVRDTGIGIPTSEQSRVFERFYRVDKSHSKLVGGTGLGLSIVKHGAAFHDAEISLESTEGKGTSVTITFAE